MNFVSKKLQKESGLTENGNALMAKKWLKCFIAHFRETLECAILVQLYDFIFKVGGDEGS